MTGTFSSLSGAVDGPAADPDMDVMVAGAGFAGLYALHRLRSMGLRVRLFEAGDDVGGTWFWNRYPGARCDVESHEYSYSFSPELDQEWRWHERYATQGEILRYLNHVADRFELRPHIELNTRVQSLQYDEGRRQWQVRTSDGRDHRARFCVLATGCLSAPNEPLFPGLDRYEGVKLHTARWPAGGVDFHDRAIGVIGTGSTGIQVIPMIAQQARQLLVFQRTAHFCLPARNAPLSDAVDQAIKAGYPALRARLPHTPLGFTVNVNPASALAVSPEERRREFQSRWDAGGAGFMGSFSDLLTDVEANATAADFVRDQIRSIVKNPEVAERLCPKGYPIGSKRVCLGTDYYETFNRENVELIDVSSDPIVEFTLRGVRTAAREHALDAVIFATGFDAVTGPILRMDIRGREGRRLADQWAHGPAAYLGLGISGFPNLFLITGPGSPSVLSNMVLSVEQHVNLIADALAELDRRGQSAIEPTAEAESGWARHVDELAQATLYPRAKSWYLGANIPGKPRVFLPYSGGVGAYLAECEAVKAEGWKGYVFS